MGGWAGEADAANDQPGAAWYLHHGVGMLPGSCPVGYANNPSCVNGLSSTAHLSWTPSIVQIADSDCRFTQGASASARRACSRQTPAATAQRLRE